VWWEKHRRPMEAKLKSLSRRMIECYAHVASFHQDS
jgi:hypothetical protein